MRQPRLDLSEQIVYRESYRSPTWAILLIIAVVPGSVVVMWLWMFLQQAPEYRSVPETGSIFAIGIFIVAITAATRLKCALIVTNRAIYYQWRHRPRRWDTIPFEIVESFEMTSLRSVFDARWWRVRHHLGRIGSPFSKHNGVLIKLTIGEHLFLGSENAQELYNAIQQAKPMSIIPDPIRNRL